jgi:hypothetical protein
MLTEVVPVLMGTNSHGPPRRAPCASEQAGRKLCLIPTEATVAVRPPPEGSEVLT